MWRLYIIVAGWGAVLCWDAYRDLSLARGTTQDPFQVGLSALEAGEIPEDNHLRIGEHWEILLGAVYERDEHDHSEPSASTNVNDFYYPIVSSSSKEAQGDSIQTFAVLVQTTEYETLGEIPSASMRFAESVQGLVVSHLDRLPNDVRLRLRESFPAVDFDALLVLQKGRKPAPPTEYLGLFVVGAIMLVVGARGIYKHRHVEVC